MCVEIVKPSVEKMELGLDPVKKIEQILRVCTKSEDKITETSGEALIKKCITLKHLSILRHYRICVVLTDVEFMTQVKLKYINRYIDVILADVNSNTFTLIGNFQTFRDLLQRLVIGEGESSFVLKLYGLLCNRYKVFFEDMKITYVEPEERDNCFEDIEYMTLKITTDIGIARQFTRHTEMSAMQESTRYVDYSEVFPVVSPINKEKEPGVFSQWKLVMEELHVAYRLMAKNRIPKDVRRSILPLCLKTDLYLTAPLDAWGRFIETRSAHNVHYGAKALMPAIINEYNALIAYCDKYGKVK